MSHKGLHSLIGYYQIPFFNTAYSLIALQGSTSFMGYLFWVLITRLFTQSQIGFATALYSASLLLVGLSGLGLDDGLAYFLPRVARPGSLVSASYSLSMVTAMVLTVGFLIGLTLWSPDLKFVYESLVTVAFFLAGTVFLSISALQDAIFIAERNADKTLYKGVLINLLRFPIVLLFISLPLWSFLLSAVMASLVGFFIFGYLYQKRIRPAYRFRPELHPSVWKPVIGYSFSSYLANQLLALPNTLLPVLVLHQLGAAPTAYFFVAWMLASTINVIGRSFGVSLLVESGRNFGSIGQNTRRALTVATAVLIPAVIGLSILVRPLLLVLGKDYSTQSATLVVLLAVSSIPLTFQGIAVGVLKARARIKSLLVTGVVFTVLHLGFSAWLVSYWGLTGVGIAVILARTLSAALAFLLAFGDKLPARFSGIFNHLWTNE